MGFSKNVFAGLVLAAIVPAAPVGAGEIDNAIQIRKLDMMLMATSLRCRFGADNFQADYERIKVRHRQNFKLASERVLGDMTRRMGRKNAINSYDRMSTGMANEYGTGHPWLDCGQLKREAQALASTSDMATLDMAARELLSRQPSTRLALAN